jgi:hypothetical protein
MRGTSSRSETTPVGSSSDTRYGGDDLVHLAVRATRTADDHLAAGCRAPTVESDLQAAVGELAQVASWIAHDADQQQLARQLTNEALLHSRLAGDRHMELFELAQLAMQSLHLQRPGEALRIADEVIDNARTGPRVAAVFHLRRARALAQRGELSRALDEHDIAAAILRAATPPATTPTGPGGSTRPNSPGIERCQWSAPVTGGPPSTSSRAPTNNGQMSHHDHASTTSLTWPLPRSPCTRGTTPMHPSTGWRPRSAPSDPAAPPH